MWFLLLKRIDTNKKQNSFLYNTVTLLISVEIHIKHPLHSKNEKKQLLRVLAGTTSFNVTHPSQSVQSERADRQRSSVHVTNCHGSPHAHICIVKTVRRYFLLRFRALWRWGICSVWAARLAAFMSVYVTRVFTANMRTHEGWEWSSERSELTFSASIHFQLQLTRKTQFLLEVVSVAAVWVSLWLWHPHIFTHVGYLWLNVNQIQSRQLRCVAIQRAASQRQLYCF